MNTKETKTAGIIPFIIDLIAMRLHEQEALSYLSDRGYSISKSELYRLKNEVKESANSRLNLIASEEFLTQHLSRIDTLRAIEGELWSNYHLEKNPSKRSNILMQITELQQVLAAFFDSTQYVMQQSAHIKKKRKLEQEQN